MLCSSLFRVVAKVSAAVLCCLSVSSAMAQSGACCTGNSAGAVTCVVVAGPSACVGQFLGAGTVCGPNNTCTTVQPSGACCITSPTGVICSVRALANCSADGGIWKGAGTVCSNDICVFRAPCCVTTAVGVSCALTTQAQCALQQGAFHSNAAACSATLCPQPQPTGACCVAAPGTVSGTCVTTTQAGCTGTWKGAGTVCTNDICAPRAACCVAAANGPVCIIATQAQCNLQQGTFHANAAACSATLCPQPQPTGACCVAAPGTVSGTCVTTTQAGCTGTWKGANTVCSTALCAPRGACCIDGFAGPLCEVLTQAECLTATGGRYLGNNTVCTNTSCPSDPPSGACCIGPNSPIAAPLACVINTQTQCANIQGTWKGAGSVCTTTTCPNTQTGACCVSGTASGAVACQIKTQVECAAAQGQWRGAGTTCTPEICVPRGACCVPVATSPNAIGCQVLTQAQCAARNGVFKGNNSVCTTTTCPAPVRGACCVALATTGGTGATVCVVVTPADCTARQGVYRGDGSVCTNTTCPRPEPTGACCRVTATSNTLTCSVVTAAACANGGGVYKGNGTTCTADACAPRGACCHPQFTGAIHVCLDTTQAGCAQIGGTWNAGGVCETFQCPPPAARGACCRASAGAVVCTVRTQADCVALGGAYKGDSSVCTNTICPRICPCDWNSSGSVTNDDLFAFITSFQAGMADYNGDGATNQLDLTAFLSCFMNPPPACRPLPPGNDPLLAEPGASIDVEIVDDGATDASIKPAPGIRSKK